MRVRTARHRHRLTFLEAKEGASYKVFRDCGRAATMRFVSKMPNIFVDEGQVRRWLRQGRHVRCSSIKRKGKKRAWGIWWCYSRENEIDARLFDIEARLPLVPLSDLLCVGWRVRR